MMKHWKTIPKNLRITLLGVGLISVVLLITGCVVRKDGLSTKNVNVHDSNPRASTLSMEDVLPQSLLHKYDNVLFSIDNVEVISEPDGMQFLPVFNNAGETILGLTENGDLYKVSYPNTADRELIVNLGASPSSYNILSGWQWSWNDKYVYYQNRFDSNAPYRVFEIDLTTKSINELGIGVDGILSYASARPGEHFVHTNPDNGNLEIAKKDANLTQIKTLSDNDGIIGFTPGKEAVVTVYSAYAMADGSEILNYDRSLIGWTNLEYLDQTGEFGLFTQNFGGGAHDTEPSSSSVAVAPLFKADRYGGIQLTEMQPSVNYVPVGISNDGNVIFYRLYADGVLELFRADLIQTKN